MDQRTKILQSIGNSAFWQHDPSEGMGSVNLVHKYPNMDLGQWSEVSRQQVQQDLESRMGRAYPNLRGEKLSESVHSASSSLEEALFISAEKEVRKKSCSMMRQMATKLEQASAHPENIKSLLEDVQQTEPGTERVAMLEALGLAPEAARGLDVQMTMHDTEELFQKLDENRLAMFNRSPLGLQELADSMKTTASDLRSLARRIEVQRDINIFDLCPQIARGLMSKMKKDSIAYQALDKRLKAHQTYKKMDKVLQVSAGILFEIGAMVLGPVGEIANVIWNVSGAAHGLSDGIEQLKRSRLSSISGGMSQQDFAKARESAYGEIVQGAVKVYTRSVPFSDSALELAGAIESTCSE